MSKGYETMKDPIMIESKETKKSIGVLREIQQRFPTVIQNQDMKRVTIINQR